MSGRNQAGRRTASLACVAAVAAVTAAAATGDTAAIKRLVAPGPKAGPEEGLR